MSNADEFKRDARVPATPALPALARRKPRRPDTDGRAGTAKRKATARGRKKPFVL